MTHHAKPEHLKSHRNAVRLAVGIILGTVVDAGGQKETNRDAMIVHWQQQKAEALKDLASIGKGWSAVCLFVRGVGYPLRSRLSTDSTMRLRIGRIGPLLVIAGGKSAGGHIAYS